jgi:hypothetical protein
VCENLLPERVPVGVVVIAGEGGEIIGRGVDRFGRQGLAGLTPDDLEAVPGEQVERGRHHPRPAVQVQVGRVGSDDGDDRVVERAVAVAQVAVDGPADRWLPGEMASEEARHARPGDTHHRDGGRPGRGEEDGTVGRYDGGGSRSVRLRGHSAGRWGRHSCLPLGTKGVISHVGRPPWSPLPPGEG